jgi:hypothetical protein
MFASAVRGGFDEDVLLPLFGGRGLYAAAAARGERKGKAATLNAIRAVALLREDAWAFYVVASRRRKSSGRPEARSLKKLVAALASIYSTFWEEEPGYWTDMHKEPRGAFMALMVGVTDAIRARGVRFYSSPVSLGKIFDRLEPSDKMRFTELLKKAGRTK